MLHSDCVNQVYSNSTFPLNQSTMFNFLSSIQEYFTLKVTVLIIIITILYVLN